MDITSQAIGEYRDFLLSDTYLYPTKDKGIYRASELIPFFESSRTELETLLKKVPLGKPDVVCSNEAILHEYTLVGHGNTGTNKDGNITGWSGDMLCTSWTEKVKRNGVEVEEKMMGGIEQARYHSKEIKPGEFFLCFVSDLPRAIHHALMLHGNKDLETHLESFSDKISNEIKRMGKIVDRQIYRDLISLTLENGFIPTPFLRSHYYGPLELHPAKLDESNKKAWIDSAIAKGIASGLDCERAREEAEKLAYALMHRKELFFAPRDADGTVLTENRVNLVNRIASFYDSVNKVSEGRKVLVVGSTGCFDASKAYFLNFGQPDKQLKVENDPTERGRVLNAKLGNLNGKPCYLNDPLLLKKIREDSEKICADQRRASLDKGIRNQKDPSLDEQMRNQKNQVIPVELLGFKKEERGKYESYKVTLDDLLKFDLPTKPEERITPALLLGNFGQGKSTAAVELAERLNSDDEYKNDYVPVFLTARDINGGLLNKLLSNKEDGPKNTATILDLLSQGVPSLPLSLRKEYKPIFIIDALDELSSDDLRGKVIRVARDLLSEYGKVIVTSRFTGFDQYVNEGFDTFHLDPNAVIRNLDVYLTGRILDKQSEPDPQRLKEFKEFLMRQDDGVKTNYLLVHFLSNLYNNNPEKLRKMDKPLSEGEILISGIEHALWDHTATKRSDMQKPSPDEGESEKAFKIRLDEYDVKRSDCLKPWMNFLQKVAAYMTIHNTSTIDRKGLEEVQGDWSIADYLSKSKVK